MITDLDYTRVYLPGARIAHLLDEGSSPNRRDPSACGVVVPPLGVSWHGTGNWDEMELAKVKPLCQRCAEAVRIPSPARDARLRSMTQGAVRRAG